WIQTSWPNIQSYINVSVHIHMIKTRSDPDGRQRFQMIAGPIQRTLGNPKLLSDENKQDTIARLRDWQAVTGQQTFLASDNFIPEGAFKMKLVKLSAMRNERSKKLFSLISALPSTAILRGGLAAILYALVFTG